MAPSLHPQSQLGWGPYSWGPHPPPIPNPAISGTALGTLQHCFQKRLGENSILLQSFPPQGSEVTHFMSCIPTPPLQAPCHPPPGIDVTWRGVRMPHLSRGVGDAGVGLRLLLPAFATTPRGRLSCPSAREGEKPFFPRGKDFLGVKGTAFPTPSAG